MPRDTGTRATPRVAPTGRRERNPLGGYPCVYGLLETVIYGLLVDMRIEEPKRDEFIDQEGLVERFVGAWAAAVEKIEAKVMKQVAAGKEEVSF
jgi:hypothetical protein